MKSVTTTTRVCFFVGKSKDGAFVEKSIEFSWYMGMNWQMRQKSSISLHENIVKTHPNSRILEVSTKSEDYALGKALSAFNLKKDGIPIENIFQSSKVFSDGGPYLDLLEIDPASAKKDPRISTAKNIRTLTSFEYAGKKYPTEPKSFFYDYIYISALSDNKTLSEKIINYDVFTDIEFNQKIPYSDKKGPFNCQARSCAIYVWLQQNNLLNKYLENPNSLIEQIYTHSSLSSHQASLFPDFDE